MPMNESYKDKLTILCQRLPIGLRHGLALLEQNNGDIGLAEKQFQNEVVALVIQKTDVTEDIARAHLAFANYDVNLALKSIDEQRYTLTERILKRYKNNKTEALEKIADAIEKHHKIHRSFWLDFRDLVRLPPETSCVIIIMEWFNYDGWEGFDYALYQHLDIVTDRITNQLHLPEVSHIMQEALSINKAQAKHQRHILRTTGSCGTTPEFAEQENLFDERRPLLIDALHAFVIKHIDKFP